MRKKEHIYEEFLVASAKLGDQTAMTRLVALRGPKLLAHATRLLGNVEQARDATQDAWIEILKGLKRLNDDRAFASWAYMITTRRCARIIKTTQSQRQVAQAVLSEENTSEAEKGPEAADAHTVRNAIKTLPANQQATVALFYLEDMSVTEVARALDIPNGTVKTRLMHARTKLKEALKGEWDE